MKLIWSTAARRDLTRLHDFLKPVNPRAATQVIKRLGAAAQTLPEFPERGHQVARYLPQNVRSFFVDDYEMRYEIIEDEVLIVRIWHMREDR